MVSRRHGNDTGPAGLSFIGQHVCLARHCHRSYEWSAIGCLHDIVPWETVGTTCSLVSRQPCLSDGRASFSWLFRSILCVLLAGMHLNIAISLNSLVGSLASFSKRNKTSNFICALGVFGAELISRLSFLMLFTLFSYANFKTLVIKETVP